jgi:phosphoribosyl 1,2-cyclic phosphodiesterase
VLEVTFYGVRGSTPCACEDTRRYGGNTACVAVEVVDAPPIVLDMGTGLRFFGETQPKDGSFHGAALVSHLHWDHVQGLPFFVPILREGASLDIYAPPQDDGRPVADAFDDFMRSPYFPIAVRDLPGEVRFHVLHDEHVAIGDAKVWARCIPHIGPTNGYRIDWNGASVAYLPDHQQPVDGTFVVADAALALADGVDLLIHDSQYTPVEFTKKATWGHCTMEYALFVAREAGAKRLALFHHDPVRTDDELDELAGCWRTVADRFGIDVVAAREGLRITLG